MVKISRKVATTFPSQMATQGSLLAKIKVMKIQVIIINFQSLHMALIKDINLLEDRARRHGKLFAI